MAFGDNTREGLIAPAKIPLGVDTRTELVNQDKWSTRKEEELLIVDTRYITP